MPSVPAGHEEAAKSFGARVAAARGHVSQAQMAESWHISPGFLSKIESGRRLPDLATALRMDRDLGAHGSLVGEWRAMMQGVWAPEVPASGTSRTWSAVFPVGYLGAVDIVVQPLTSLAGETHEIMLTWGFLQRRPEILEVPAEGVRLRCHKVDLGPTNPPLRVFVEPPAKVTCYQAGANAVWEHGLIDVDHDWVVRTEAVKASLSVVRTWFRRRQIARRARRAGR